MADLQKLNFLEQGLPEKLSTLEVDAQSRWGVMNAQEMVEHLADFFDISSGEISSRILTPADHLPKYLEFLRSDKEFRENTKAPAEVLGDIPMPLRKASLEEAISSLKQSVTAFIDSFKEQPERTTAHPVFGNLVFDDWVLLHYKHVVHHLKQFGLL